MDSSGSYLIVSMTTIPDRMEKMKVVVRNLQFQSRLPDKTILYIPEVCRRTKQPYKIPTWCSDPTITKPINFEIHTTPADFGPGTKLFPALKEWFLEEEKRKKYLITIDDDVILEDHTFEELCGAAATHPNMIMAMMIAEGDNFIHAETVGELTMVKRGNLGGYRSILYPSSALSPDVVKKILEHQNEIQKLHAGKQYPILDDDHLVGSLLWFLDVKTAVIPTKYPGNVDADNIIDMINLIFLKNSDGVNNGSSNIEQSRNIVEGYLSKLITKTERKDDRNIYEIIPFNGEYELLDLHLAEHVKFVDKIYIVEAGETFTNISKPFYYKEKEERYQKYSNKITYLTFDKYPELCDSISSKIDYIRNYPHTRNVMKYNNNDFIIISNVDEIINPELGKSMRFYLEYPSNNQLYNLTLDFYYYNYNWKKKMLWRSLVVCSCDNLKTKTPSEIRSRAGRYSNIDDAGWHFSYCLNYNDYQRKIKTFAHQQYNEKKYLTQEHFNNITTNGYDLFLRGQKEDCVWTTNDDLPENIHLLTTNIVKKDNDLPKDLKLKDITEKLTKFRSSKQYQSGFDFAYPIYQKLIKSLGISNVAPSPLISDPLLLLFLDDLFICTFQLRQSQKDKRKISEEIYQAFINLSLDHWSFYKNYQFNSGHYDRNMKYCGLSYQVKEKEKNYDKSRYDVVTLDGNEGFNEIKYMIQECLIGKGLKSDIINYPNMNSMNIILGVGFPPRVNKFPSNCILINLEQLYPGANLYQEFYLNIIKSNTYWDYNSFNGKFMDKVPLIKFGYSQKNNYINSYDDSKHDIDVLFFGTPHERREHIKNSLLAKGLKVIFMEKCFDDKKIELLKRAKIVLNIHYYKYFEICRVGYLLNNCRFIISESSPDDPEWSHLHTGFVRTDYDNLISTTLNYLSKPDERKQIATKGFDLYKSLKPDLPI